MKSRSDWKFTAVIVAASFLASAQSDVVPVNDRPNPYQPGASSDVGGNIYGAVVPARQLLRYAGGQEPR
jgi:hypothetical protein